MTKDAKADFWDRVDDVQAGMLGLTSDGKLVPMSPNLRKAIKAWRSELNSFAHVVTSGLIEC